MNRNVILVTIDGLGAPYVGTYGNSWIPTPAINRFAARSRVFDNCVADSLSVTDFVKGILTGKHATGVFNSSENEYGFVQGLASLGIGSYLVSDDDEVLDHPLCNALDDVISAEVADTANADRAERTRFFSVIANAVAVIENQRAPFFVWIHATGMSTAWDAPLDLRDQFHDEDDPPPSDQRDVPCVADTTGMDPDTLFPIAMAYAGQVTLVDLCWDLLVESMSDAGVMENSLVILSSPRGFPLGDHGSIGLAGAKLYSESIHVPLLVYAPTSDVGGDRSAHFVQPPDLNATMRTWLELAPSSSGDRHFSRSVLQFGRMDAAPRDFVVCTGSDDQAIRTPAWFLRVNGAQRELFVKPDDVWDINNVADKCPEVADKLAVVLENEQNRLKDESLPPAEPLEQILLAGLD